MFMYIEMRDAPGGKYQYHQEKQGIQSSKLLPVAFANHIGILQSSHPEAIEIQRAFSLPKNPQIKILLNQA